MPTDKLIARKPSTIPKLEKSVKMVQMASKVDAPPTVKAVGEPPLMLGISVLMALSDALLSCGKSYPALDAPATAEQILMSIERMRHGV